ncbi:ABC transporter permease [Microbacterium telephonicum]|uniref:Peptide/nickel transport system permease protein n=1 Tax=Microbacterium telephonicum TaxID=1714841 RepID=A0A498CI33_9MICO|nr:ABC transporter permease [Microbacterium telephonicum]RLK52680.1 peptide/nickel transport system permease protein [Microbacterium telephonicum]
MRDILRLRTGRVAVVLLLSIVLLAVLGPVLAPYDPLQGSDDILAGPSAAHWLGTDNLGRDVLSRLLHGAPLSVFGTALLGAIALVVGAVPGILSVFLGRSFEWVSLRVVDTLISLPFLVFAVAITALLGNGLLQALVAVGVLISPLFFRVARAATLQVAGSQYVEAALLSGATVPFVVRRHVTGKVLPVIGVALANTLGAGLVVVASLSFLGIGVQPPTPTWGGDLAADLRYLPLKPFAPVFPAALIMITVLGLNLLADALRDVTGEAGRALLARTGARRRSGTDRPGSGGPASDRPATDRPAPARTAPEGVSA